MFVISTGYSEVLVGPLHSSVTTSRINLFHPYATPSCCRDELNEDKGVKNNIT